MDYSRNQEYKKLYDQLVTTGGREELSDPKAQEDFIKKANEYISEFKNAPVLKPETFLEMNIAGIWKNMVLALVGVIKDFREVIIKRHMMSNQEISRALTSAVLRKDRRFYMGLWVILFAFVFYFLDASM